MTANVPPVTEIHRSLSALVLGLSLILYPHCSGSAPAKHKKSASTLTGDESTGTRPAPPASLTARLDGPRVMLYWDTPTGTTGFEVYRAGGLGASFERIATPSVPSYTDSDVVAWVDYIYAVRATSRAGISDNSPEAAITPKSPIYPGSFTIRNAGDAVYFTPVTHLTGDLTIHSDTLSTLTLANLQRVDGNLTVASSPPLSSVQLPALVSVGKDLTVNGNPLLPSLTGFRNVTSVGRDLLVADNALLAGLGGLAGLTHLGRNLTVSANPLLTNINGLEHVPALTGSLEVSFSPAVTDLSALASLHGPVVDLILTHNGNGFSSLAGLGGITAIRRDLDIEYNPALTTVTALSAVTEVAGFAEISYNPSLTSVDGLNEVTRVGGYFHLTYDDAVTSIAGLAKLTAIHSALVISSHTLTSLNGLQSLSVLDGGLVLYYCYALTDVTALSNLTTFGTPILGLMIGESTSLTSLNGFQGLTTLGGPLKIYNNPALTDLSGLSNLAHSQEIEVIGNNALVGLGLTSLTGNVPVISIQSNPSLCTTLANGLVGQVTITNWFLIQGNKGC